MLMLPDLRSAAASLGKWRYFLTGLPLAVLLGMIVRAFGKLTEPFGRWRVFSGTCTGITKADDGYVLTVRFQDSKRLTHTAAFRSRHASLQSLSAGDDVTIAIRTEIFAAGSYTADPAQAAENDGDILLRAEHRVWLLRTLLRTLLRELILCGIALLVFLAAMHFCFPK